MMTSPRPHTPLLDNLTATTGAGWSDPCRLLFRALANWRRQRVPTVIAVLGEPTAGKSTLSSEIVALAAYYLGIGRAQARHGGRVEFDTINYVSWEQARDVAYPLGLVPADHVGGRRTAEDYSQINALCGRILAAAIHTGGITIFESAALATRGDLPVAQLGRREGPFAGLTYEVMGIWLAPSPSLFTQAARVREDFERHPERKIEALARLQITGGDAGLLRVLYAELFPVLFAAEQAGVSSPEFAQAVDHVESFADPSIRSRYLQICYGPYLMLQEFGLSPRNVTVCENRVLSGVILHQYALDQYGYIERLQADGQLAHIGVGI